MKLAGRHAMITGGSSGIGFAIAKELARQGSHVHIAARRPDVLEGAVTAIRAACPNSTGQVTAYQCDIASRADVAALFDRLRSAASAPSIVVNSAGVTGGGYFQSIPVEDFERIMQINFFGTLYVTKEAVADMLVAGEGWILNISSVAGQMAVFGLAPYCASKFAVNGFTQTIRKEMKKHGISVSLLCPPDTDTPMLEVTPPIRPKRGRSPVRRECFRRRPWRALRSME